MPDASPDATKSEGGSSEAGAPAGPAIKHIFYIMMENHGRSEIIGSLNDAGTLVAPNITALAQQYGTATSYYGVTHPSLPNYLAAISGDNQGIYDDCKAGPDVFCAAEEFIPADAGGDNTSVSLLTPEQALVASTTPHWFRAPTIVDQLEAKGKTWIAYMESIPGAGDTSEYWPYATTEAGAPDLTTPRKLYAQKHDPFMYFESVRTNAARMSKIVPFTQAGFTTDVTTVLDGGASKVPSFVWISPNQCNDMHSLSKANANSPEVSLPGCEVDSTSIGMGDTFVQSTVTSIMASPAWAEGSAIVIVWDEDDYSGVAGCCNSPKGQTDYLGGANVPAIVISSLIPAGTSVVSKDPYNHYSLLATIQKLLGLDCLGNTCGMKGSQLMTKLFVPATTDGGAAPEAATPDTGASDASPDASEAGASSTDASEGDSSSTDAGSEASDAPTGN